MATQNPLKSIHISAPGKIILHGEHSVVYGKLALATSLGLRTKLQLDELTNGRIHIQLRSLHFDHSYNLVDFAPILAPLTELSGNQDVVHCKTVELLQNFIKATAQLDSRQELGVITLLYLIVTILTPSRLLSPNFGGLHFQLDSELSLGAGTGSSASYSVTIAGGLFHYLKLKQNPTSKLMLFSGAELEAISEAAYNAEKIIHGTPSGVDNTICTYGGLVEFRRGVPPKLIPILAPINLLLINTNIGRNTKVLVEKAKQLRHNHQGVVDCIFEAMNQISEQASIYLQSLNGGGDYTTDDIYSKLIELCRINHNLLRSLGVSHPKLDEACCILAQYGLEGKLTGAGGGGYAISLVPPSISADVLEKIIDHLQQAELEVTYTKLGGSGVTID